MKGYFDMRPTFIIGVLILSLFGTTDSSFPVTAEPVIVHDGWDDAAVAGAGKGDVIPDIKVNEHDGPVSYPQGTFVDIHIALDPGSQTGVPHDWWIFIRRNSGPAWWNRYSTGQWINSTTPIRFSGGALRVVC